MPATARHLIANCGLLASFIVAGCGEVAPLHPSVRRSEPAVPAVPADPIVPAEPAVPAEPVVPADPTVPVPTVSEIMLADTSGVVIGRLTVGRSPAWSRDGKRVAFERSGALCIIDVETLRETQLGAGRSPSWSPDDARLAFVGEEGIQTIATDGSMPRTILRHGFRDDTYAPWDLGVGQPAWSPDGNRIAFSHLGDGDMQPGVTFVMGSDGSNPRRITSDMFPESYPAWSPDGSLIAFRSNRFGIALARFDDGRPQAIWKTFPLVAYGTKPAWSPSGEKILFNYGHGITEAIWVYQASVGSTRRLIENGHDAVWSPRRPVIAFVRGPR